MRPPNFLRWGAHGGEQRANRMQRQRQRRWGWLHLSRDRHGASGSMAILGMGSRVLWGFFGLGIDEKDGSTAAQPCGDSRSSPGFSRPAGRATSQAPLGALETSRHQAKKNVCMYAFPGGLDPAPTDIIARGSMARSGRGRSHLKHRPNYLFQLRHRIAGVRVYWYAEAF